MLYLESIIVYTLLTLLMCFGAYHSQKLEKQSKFWEWMPIFLFTMVFGLRYGVGIDYNNYYEIFSDTEGYPSFLLLIENERFEIGFSLIIYLCHLLHAPVWFFFTILAFLQIWLLHKAFCCEGNILIYIYATLIFTGFCMYGFMNIIRHDIAFCFFLYSLKFIKEKKLIKYWLCCLLALSFHHSALIIFPLYFIWVHRKTIFHRPKIEMIAILSCFALSFITQWQNIMHTFDFLIVLLGYEDYIEAADEMVVNNKIGITRILNLIVNIIVVLNSKKIKEYFHSDTLYILYDLYIIGICLEYVFLGSMMLQRAIVYFSHTQFIIWAYTLCYLYQTRRQSIPQLLKYSIVALFILTSYSSFIYNCTNNTGAYVFYFQTGLHDTKDNLRSQMIDNRL